MNSHGLQSEVITARRWECSLPGEQCEWKSCCKDGLVGISGLGSEPWGSAGVSCPALLPLPSARSSAQRALGCIVHPTAAQRAIWDVLLGTFRGCCWGVSGGCAACFQRGGCAVVPVAVTPVVSPRAGEAALRGEPRMQPLQSPALSNHRTGPPPISPSKRKLSMDQGDEELDCENDHVSKMSRMFNPHL